jgi:hypothetical protein
MKSQKRATGFGNQFPPDERHIRVYFLQQGSTVEEAVKFFDYYKAKGWLNSDSRQLKNWKRLAWTWIFYR